MITAELHDGVCSLLKRASDEIILPYYQNLQAGDVEEKSPGELVTIADRLSEDMLSNGLAGLLPGAGIVGEEAVATNPTLVDQLGSDLVWIIDPIDGTSNFTEGKPPFGIIIALAEKNKTLAGWLYDPLSGRLCHAVKDAGTFVNGKRIVVQSGDLPEKPIAALATGFMTPKQRDAVIAAAKPHYQIVDIPRCAAEQYPRLALGENHISVFERTLPWDHAAGILFLNEAGGKAARWDGSPYRPTDQKTGLLGASSPELWERAAELLGDIFAG